MAAALKLLQKPKCSRHLSHFTGLLSVGLSGTMMWLLPHFLHFKVAWIRIGVQYIIAYLSLGCGAGKEHRE
jgi:hypothetical protein